MVVCCGRWSFAFADPGSTGRTGLAFDLTNKAIIFPALGPELFVPCILLVIT